jgi:hypothetical protein
VKKSGGRQCQQYRKAAQRSLRKLAQRNKLSAVAA